ncbi:hypothetical protein [Amycolatopsis sp. NPDC051071]|uniref:hypothetical protein n=1 Tax=Amycolatopsis sp. NPDC051071 TaxID=3154637 RepID=UPI003436735D
MERRFAVSTLGMPGVPVAAAHGCHGLKFRAHPDEVVHRGLSERKAAQLRALIEGVGLEVARLAGDAKVCAPGPDEPVIAGLRELIALAHGRSGETPAETRAVLGGHLGYFQVKDVVSGAGRISLEWEKAWYPDIVPVATPSRAAATWFTNSEKALSKENG